MRVAVWIESKSDMNGFTCGPGSDYPDKIVTLNPYSCMDFSLPHKLIHLAHWYLMNYIEIDRFVNHSDSSYCEGSKTFSKHQ